MTTAWAYTPRDLLSGVIALTGVALKRPAALDEAARLCFNIPDQSADWFPKLVPAHAREVIAYATSALRIGVLSKIEHDYICDKARRSMIRLT